VQTLVVWAPGERSAEEVPPILAEVSARHPSRMILLLPRPEQQEPTSAYVTALCHVAGKSKQVCCEQIVIQAGPDGLRRLPSIVQPLLVPDLPVVLWWRDRPPAGERLFQELRDSADRVILDSSEMADPLQELPKLAAALGSSRWTGYSDLAWSGLTPWRSMLAGFFDVPALRPHLARLDRVEIEALAPTDTGLPVQTVLLAGWLASRLRWLRAGPLARGANGEWQATMQAEGRSIRLTIWVRPAQAAARERIESVRLGSAEGPASFAVQRGEQRDHLATCIEIAGAHQCGTVLRVEPQEEAELLGHEFEIPRHDRVYEAALRFWAGS